jgi:hypothetical protein
MRGFATMTRMAPKTRERGIALLTVLLVGFALSAIALASTMWILNAQILQKNGERAAVLHDAAIAALEEGRSRLSATPAVYPDTGFVQLDTNAVIRDASGVVLPGLRRNVYAGPDGVTSGQYGVFGTVIATVRDTFGNQVVRRLQVHQESFAKYAYFTTVEGDIVFANNDQIWGPVHSNDQIEIHSSGAIFENTVTTAASSIKGEGYGQFRGGPARKSVPPIPLPTTAAFSSLKMRAANGGFEIAGNTNGSASGEASVRIEFVALDLNGDGDSTDVDEGFIRIYQNNAAPGYVTAQLADAGGDMRDSRNCGIAMNASNNPVPGNPAANSTATFKTAFSQSNSKALTMLTTSGAKCYLGGDPRLAQTQWEPDSINLDATAWAAVQGAWSSGGGIGWRPRPAGMGAPPTSNPKWNARPDKDYLWPISRAWNPYWEGVIYVEGRVAISGVVNGRVTLATTESIVIADDVRTAVDPGAASAGDCSNILGLFAGKNIMVADNVINTPQELSGKYRTYDWTPEEDVHAVVLALSIFGAEDYNTGPTSAENCGTSNAGRGCLELKGGIIQKTRGAVGLTGGQGYIKRYQYNACALTDPPPYFPTTGKFARNRTYELDPRNFDVAAWFAANQNN